MLTPQLVAHRGYPLHYPDNSLAGIEAAIHAGARYLEIDVQLSRDRIPVLFHDRSLDRVCGVAGPVHDYDLARLKSFGAGDYGRFGYRYSQARIATLGEFAELLKRNPTVTAFVELKRVSIERFGVAEVLNQVRPQLQRVVSQCVLISYSLEALAAARRHGWPALGAVIDRWRERKQHLIREIKPDYLFCDLGGLPRWGRLRADDMKLVVFEVTSAQLALKLARRGVAYIETFAIGELLRELELRAAVA